MRTKNCGAQGLAPTAVSFYSTARGFLHSSQIVMKFPEFPGRSYLQAPLYVLIGFSLELFLKAFLADRGVKEMELRDIGHDLQEAYATALRLGFVPTDDLLRQVIDYMHPLHLHHEFRYMRPNQTLVIPNLAQTIAVLDRLDDQISLLIQAREKIAS